MAIKVNGKLVAGLGKSAYEQAQEGGYTGTEEEFISALANIGSNPTAEGLPVNDVRTGTVRDGQSIAAGDVVNVQDGEIYHDVVAQKNVENVIKSGVATTGTALCKLSLQHSVLLIIAGNITAFLIDNVTGKILFNSVVYQQSSSSVSLARLDDSHFVVTYVSGNDFRIQGYTVSGTSLTPMGNAGYSDVNEAIVIGFDTDSALSIAARETNIYVRPYQPSITTLYGGKSLSGIRPSNISATRIPDDDSGNKRVCICFSDTGDGNKGKAVIATIDSANAVTFGEVVTVINSTAHQIPCTYSDGVIYALSQTRLYVLNEALSVLDDASLYGSGTSGASTSLIGLPTGVVAVNGSTNYNAVFATWNGTTIEHGSPYRFNIGDPSSYLSGTQISNNEILLAYADTGNSNYGTTTILEIFGNQIAGSFLNNSKDAIALESGEGGDTIKLGFGGYCACEGITAGQTIDSEGVTAYSPLDGWLEIKDSWARGYVTGEYTGNSAAVFNIDLGFKPAAIAIADVTYNNTFSIICFRGCSQLNYMNETTLKSAGITWNDAGVSLSDAASLNSNNYKYRYIAWR
ncbi:MAG: hypothetical protein KH195_11815 [Clostridiaceae bacterium]|nr:hypothetical protein [Clostridiaceae bacterium]